MPKLVACRAGIGIAADIPEIEQSSREFSTFYCLLRVPLPIQNCKSNATAAPRRATGHTPMDYRVSYEHSLKSDPDAFIGQVPSQLVEGVSGNIPRALLPEYIAELILGRSPIIGKIRNLRVL